MLKLGKIIFRCILISTIILSGCGGGGSSSDSGSPTDPGGSSSLSSDADLLNIVINTVTLNQVFSSETINYTATVPLSTGSISVTPYVDSTATLAINDVEINSGETMVITINPGLNTIAILVTAEDDTEKTYTFTITRETTSQQAYIKALDSTTYLFFGYDVEISGDTMVVGAPYHSDGTNQLGAVYVFSRDGGTWTQQACLKIPKIDNDRQFGISVAIDGDTIVASLSHLTSLYKSAVYIFTRSGTNWTQQAILTTEKEYNRFGYSLSISGNTIAVGAPDDNSGASGVNGNEADTSLTASGAVYAFIRSGTTWSKQAYIKASNPGNDDYFGLSVAVSGDTIVSGACYEDSGATGINGNDADNSTSNSGAAYVFNRSAGTWTQQAYLKSSHSSADGQFGCSVAVDGDTIVAGENREDTSGTDSGGAYVFTRSSGTWAQQTFFKASNALSYNYYGSSVAISGDTIVIGAPYRYSYSGALYIYTRNSSTWNELAYIRASNAGADDMLGLNVGISGKTIVAGSYKEDSNAVGINGNGVNNSADSSGAVYSFIFN